MAEKDGTRSATITKQRELPGKGESIYFRLEIVEMGVSKFGSTATTCVAVPDEDAADGRPHEKPSKHDEQVKLLERTWFASKTEMRGEYPYITTSAFRNLLQNDGLSKTKINNHIDPTSEDGIIAKMLNRGIIQSYEHGWIVIDEGQASAWKISKGG